MNDSSTMRERPADSTLVYTSASGAVRPASKEAKHDRIVRIWLERKGRNGKPVSIVRGLALDDAALASLAGRLKRTCGTGGSAKDGEIIIQGDHRDRIAQLLGADGLRVKLAGG